MQIEQQIAKVFGGDKVFHHKVKGPLDLDQLIRTGLPWEAGKYIKDALQLKDSAFAALLGMSLRTFSRQKVGERMSTITGDRLYRIARIYSCAVNVLEDTDKAVRWLHREQIGLGGRIPLDMIQTEAGEREVENLLGRIEHGVLS